MVFSEWERVEGERPSYRLGETAQSYVELSAEDAWMLVFHSIECQVGGIRVHVAYD